MGTATMSTFDWQSQANCNGMDRDLFFPEYDWMVDPKVTKACGQCPVQDACLAWALARDEVGVWGGLTDEQRAAINKTQNRVRCPDCRSDHVMQEGNSEVCLKCGLSWNI